MEKYQKQISFIVQGGISSETPACLESIRNIFPDAQIILSTFDCGTLQNISHDLYDVLIINQDVPTQFLNSCPGATPNNINKQIKSTLSGLHAATSKYVFKIRTDFILTSNNFFKYFDLYKKADSEYSVFQHKILACTNFTRNPRYDAYQYLHHPSDIAFFGLRSDLINLFDVPLMTNDEEKYYARNGYLYNRYFPEQHLWVNCLDKNGHKVHFNRFEAPTSQQQTDTEKYFVSNFIFLSWAQFGLVPPAKFFDITNYYYDYNSCITHSEYVALYKKYIDNDVVVPHDVVRKKIKKLLKTNKILSFIARICVLPLFAFPQTRRKIRKNISNMGYKYLYTYL